MRELYFLLNILLKMLQFKYMYYKYMYYFQLLKSNKLLRNNNKTTVARSSVCDLEMPGRDVLSNIKSRGEKIRGFSPSFSLYFPPLAPCHCLSFLVCLLLFVFLHFTIPLCPYLPSSQKGKADEHLKTE